MKSFEYTIKDPTGIHARPAGMLSREGKKYKSAITVIKNGKSANILRLMALMGPGRQVRRDRHRYRGGRGRGYRF